MDTEYAGLPQATSPQPKASQYYMNNRPFQPSDRQLAILDYILKESGNLFVEAYAGTGKSTTLGFVISQLPRQLDTEVFAFNKSIAREFYEKFGVGTTMHRYGLKCLTNALGKLTVEGNKKNKLAQKYFPVNKMIRGFVVKLASLAINTCTNFQSLDALNDLIDHYGLEVDEQILKAKDEDGKEIPFEYILGRVGDIIIEGFEMIETEKIIDFDDMLAYPVFAGLIPQKFDILFVDEAQDTNALQIQFVLEAIKDNGRLVFVGDRNQAIYGFRGAMTDAVDTIIRTTNAKTLPLDITYRCPRSHVTQLAQLIVPGILAAEKNPEGEIRTISEDAAVREWKELDDALIMCRTNAPLIRRVLQLIKVGKKARIAGKDIAENLISLIERTDATDVNDLIQKLTAYRDLETARLREADKEDQADLLIDKVDCIFAVCEGETLVSMVIDRLESIFSDDRTVGLLFSSVHRAKGMERQHVYIIEPKQLPFKTSKPWQAQQERNLAYVAFTRSQFRMTFVGGSPDWKKLRGEG